MIFNKNVKVVQQDVRLDTDYLEAFYPEGAREPESMQAKGNVRVSEGDRLIRCLEATYQRATNSVVCRGDAVLIQGCDEVRGREIEFDLEQDHVRVVGAASVVLWPEDAAENPCGEEG